MKIRWIFGGFIVFIGLIILLENIDLIALPWGEIWSWIWKLILLSFAILIIAVPLMMYVYNQLLNLIYGKAKEYRVEINQEIALEEQIEQLEVILRKGRLKIRQHKEENVHLEGYIEILTNTQENAEQKIRKLLQMNLSDHTFIINLVTIKRYFLDFSRRNQTDARLTLYIPCSIQVKTQVTYGQVQAENLNNELKLFITNGKAKLENIGGNVLVKATNASIEAQNLAEEVRLETVNGKIKANSTIAGGSWRCSSVNGKVDVQIDNQIKEDMKLDTVNGKIYVYAAQDIDALITAKTVNGKIISNFNWDTVKRGYQQTILGTGQANLDLSTVNGKIEIKHNEG